MVGFKRIKLILGIFIPFFAIFVMSHNTSAASLSTSSFDLHARWTVGYNYQWFNNLVYGSPNSTNSNSYINVSGNGGAADQFQFNTPSVTAGGNYATIHFETNLVCSNTTPGCVVKFVNLAEQNLITCAASGTQVISKNLQTTTTDWVTTIGNTNYYNNTLTFYGDIVMSGFNQNGAYNFTCLIGNGTYPFYWNAGSIVDRLYFEQNPATITWSNDKSAALLEAQNAILETQNYLMERQNQMMENYYNSLEQSVNNIENQNSGDIPNSTNQQTTNLINIITSFISQISGNGTGQACSITLPFPEFAGGSRSVNVCTDRDKLSMNGLNYVVIFANLALICFFVPICFILLRMIYSEIRSWTNG